LAHFHSEGWELHLCGGLSDMSGDLNYFKKMKSLALGFPIYFHANIPFSELQELYGKSSIYWHAAGNGIDEQVEPEKMEHFGISTVEAMANRCVPIVYNGGGQPEIVTDGVSGFCWNTVDELVNLTKKVIVDTDIMRNISHSAYERSKKFWKPSFASNLERILRRNGVHVRISR
jgi:glycosyltransferase involved in cell wall biosynthesis